MDDTSEVQAYTKSCACDEPCQTNAPQRVETGAKLAESVTIAFTAGDGSSLGYEPWPNTFSLTRYEAIKLRDSLNKLFL